MKRSLFLVLGILLCCVGFFYGYSYYNGPKIQDGVIAQAIDAEGKPVEFATEFSPEDAVYFAAKVNRFWVDQAKVVWYKDEIAIENRVLVEEDIKKNDAGYFTAMLKAPEALEEGMYVVTIYEEGNNIRETTAEFSVVK